MSWGYVAVGVGTAVGGYLGSKEKESGIQSGTDTLKKILPYAEKTKEGMDPYSEYRQEMADTLYGYVTGKKSITTDPGYQFTMNQAMQETGRAASAKGYGKSGNVMAALQDRASNIASQQYGSIIDRLTNLAGASSQNALGAGQQYGKMVTTALTGVAEGQAAAGAAKGAGTSGAIGSIGTMIGGILGG